MNFEAFVDFFTKSLFYFKKKEENDQFSRYEDKYILTKDLVEKFTPLMKKNLDNASPIPNTDFTIIESIYFDNAELSTLQDYLLKKISAQKSEFENTHPMAFGQMTLLLN